MKKILIYTIRSHNFGNRLQNYALQTTILGLGYDCKTAQTQSLDEKTEEAIMYHPQLKKCRSVAKIYAKHKFWFKKVLNKADAFEYFDKKYIRESDAYISKDEISEDTIKQYDAIVAGSDQIWNTTLQFISINSFLPFEHPLKVAYAASFGVYSIPDDENIVKCLTDFKALSVREDAGAKIIESLTGREADVVVDPTLLLSAEKWRKLEKKPVDAEEEYILTFFLSPMNENAEQVLQEVSGQKKVYNLIAYDDKIGPSEFLWLFDHASLILTDSFHACVFSFLFNKPFKVFDRNFNFQNMNSRLETLLSKFDLERKYDSSGLQNDIWEHDYTKGYQQLELERKKSYEFLKKALEDEIR